MSAWTPTELDAIRRGVDGEIGLSEMFDLLPRRPVKGIRIKYANHGDPDEEIRHNRSCVAGCFGYARALAATGKCFG